MPTVLRPGQKVKGYSIARVLNKGAFAVAYEARSAGGERVFLKQYKSPSISVDWYAPYVAYQRELKRRVESTSAKSYSYRFIEFFESRESGQQCFYQVFEFVDKGKDLRKYLDELAGRPVPLTWPQRLTFARLFMAGMKALHDARIVHCDLKPENIYLVPDATIKAGYQLKIVDMDFSVLADQRAPWHGQQGYVGTPGYQSPEHLSGQVPLPASDVFTCGLILYELLAQGHPYLLDDESALSRAVKAYKAARPKLLGDMAPAVNDVVAETLYRCLNPDARQRPSAAELHTVLVGRGATSTAVPPLLPPPLPVPPPLPTSAPPETKPTAPPPPAAPSVAPPASPGVELAGADGQTLRLNVRTEIGRTLCRKFGEDARFMGEPQFALERDAGGQWKVIPNPAATNETLLNGKAVTAPTALKEGDVLSVGREAKGVSKLPLTVRIKGD